MCLFKYDGKVLLTKGYDSVKDEYFYRVPGGHVEFKETAEQGLRREIREELQSDIGDLVLVDVIENIFEYEGESGHEIIFLYTGKLTDTSLYDRKVVPFLEDDGSEHEAVWINVSDIIAREVLVYPTFEFRKVLAGRK